MCQRVHEFRVRQSSLRLLLQLARTNIPLDIHPDKAVQPTNRTQRRAKKPKPVSRPLALSA